jgi:hypothetical protein
MSRKALSLPDLDDDEFTRRLRPLEVAMLSPSAHPTAGAASAGGLDAAEALDRPVLAGDRKRPAGRQPAHSQDTDYPDSRLSGNTDIRLYDTLDSHPSVSPNIRSDGYTDIHNKPATLIAGSADPGREGLVGAAEHLAHIERIRGPKRRFEYLIPARVGDALAEDAARRGKSATARLLEVLRDAGFPVIPEDLIDLRRERRR